MFAAVSLLARLVDAVQRTLKTKVHLVSTHDSFPTLAHVLATCWDPHFVEEKIGSLVRELLALYMV